MQSITIYGEDGNPANTSTNDTTPNKTLKISWTFFQPLLTKNIPYQLCCQLASWCNLDLLSRGQFL